jgi:hypothetical protein
MRTMTAVHAVLDFDVAQYVHSARATGRDLLDPGLRGRMAELYHDLAAIPRADQDVLSAGEHQVLQLARLLLQSEWRLAIAPRSEPDQIPYPGWDSDVPGKRYIAYANLRILNEALGTSRHSSDAAVEARCWPVLRQLAESWVGYECRTHDRTETWAQQDLPDDGQLEERIDRLTGLLESVRSPAPSLPPAAVHPPATWAGYLGPAGRSNLLEFLVNLPQTTMHEENAFLRVIHLTEATNWGMIARLLAATEWLKAGRWRQAASCLTRAAALAEVQLAAIILLRRTMSVDRFLAFRDATGEASAVQSLSGQLLHIHLTCVHPGKLEALSTVPENAHLLLYRNPVFEPLRKALGRIPEGHPPAAEAMAAARKFDEVMFHWRRVHLGLAHRYLPGQSAGSGGTSGASYLQGFYLDRLFDGDGELVPQPPAPQPLVLPEGIHARSAFSPLN